MQFALFARQPKTVTNAKGLLLQVEALEQRDCPAASWSSYGYDSTGSRDNPTETILKATNVAQLGLSWDNSGFGGYGTPTVVKGVVYYSNGSQVIAANETNGVEKWAVTPSLNGTTAGFFSASILIIGQMAVIGDWNGNVWGLNIANGATKWMVHPNVGYDPLPSVYSSAIAVGNDVALGFASNEEQHDTPPPYLANGSIALLDPTDGHVIWQTYMIPQAAYNAGWRGVSVWSTPTYDAKTKTLYAATGNYFIAGTDTDPGVEDAILSLNAATGAIDWTDQLVKGDIWNGTIVPGPNNPDADIGDTPKIITLASGETVIGAGSKDGFYFVMNATTGAAVNGPSGLQLEVGGVLGGLFASGAVDQKDDRVFANGLDWPTLDQPNDPGPVGGDLYAVSLDGKTMLWDFKTASPNASGVAVANGVVYFSSMDGYTYMLNADATSATDAYIGRILTNDAYSGPSVADGRVFVGDLSFALPTTTTTKLRTDTGAFAGALTSANVSLAAGSLTSASVAKEVSTVATAFKNEIGDLAKIIGLAPPLTTVLSTDLKAEFVAINADNAGNTQMALGKIENDLNAIFMALSTPGVNSTNLVTDESTVDGALLTVSTDQIAHNFSQTAIDTATEFTDFTNVFNDLLAGRYSIAL